jgi:hypothetical protein
MLRLVMWSHMLLPVDNGRILDTRISNTHPTPNLTNLIAHNTIITVGNWFILMNCKLPSTNLHRCQLIAPRPHLPETLPQLLLYIAFFVVLREAAAAAAAADNDPERRATSPSSIRGAFTIQMLAQHATLKYSVIQTMEYRQSSYLHVMSCSSMFWRDRSPSRGGRYVAPRAASARWART